MDYGKAFTFITDSEEWVSKSLMGVVFALFLPLGGLGVLPLMGWSIGIGRRVINGESDALPEWSELGQIIVDGFKAIVIFFIWNIPVWILGGIAALVDSTAVSVIVSLCGALWGLLIAILTLGVFGILADDRSFGEAVNPVNAWEVVSANWGNTIISWILAWLAIMVAAAIGIVLCIVGVFLGWTYGFAVGGHIYGQLYRESGVSQKAAV